MQLPGSHVQDERKRLLNELIRLLERHSVYLVVECVVSQRISLPPGSTLDYFLNRFSCVSLSRALLRARSSSTPPSTGARQ